MIETLAPADRSTIVAELQRSRDAFVAAMSDVSGEAWTRRAAAGRWSPAECAEHVIRIERQMRKFLPTVVAVTPPDAARRGELAGRDATIAEYLRDRSRPRTAPDSVVPGGDRYTSAEQAVADFAEARESVLHFAETTEADLRGIFVPHPALTEIGMREIDGYQWLLFVAAHTDRHTAQLRELRAELVGVAG